MVQRAGEKPVGARHSPVQPVQLRPWEGGRQATGQFCAFFRQGNENRIGESGHRALPRRWTSTIEKYGAVVSRMSASGIFRSAVMVARSI